MNAYRISRRHTIGEDWQSEFVATHAAARQRARYWRAFGWQTVIHLWHAQEQQWIGC